MLAYLQLRAAKPNHAAWSCAEVRTAFEALAPIHRLAADSVAIVVKYFGDEIVNGSDLFVLASSSRTLESLVPADLRRHRLVAALFEMCDDSAGGAAPVSVSVPVAVASVPIAAAELKIDTLHIGGGAHIDAHGGAVAAVSPTAAVSAAAAAVSEVDASTAITRLKDVPLSGLRYAYRDHDEASTFHNNCLEIIHQANHSSLGLNSQI